MNPTNTRITMFAFTIMITQGAVFADPVMCEITFKPDTLDRNWSIPSNWDPSGPPTASQVACIKDLVGTAPKVVKINIQDEQAEALWIDDTVKFEIYGPYSFTLYDDSYIDGSFIVCPPISGVLAGRFVLGASLTIQPSGAGGAEVLSLEHDLGYIQAAPGSGAVLTVGSGMTFRGFGAVQLPMVNNGTVIATPFRLVGGGPASGDLYFESTITQNGTFVIEQGATAFLTNNLTIPSGALLEFESSGSDIVRLQPRSGYSPTFTVSSGGLVKGAGESLLKIINNGKVAARDGTLNLKEGGDGTGIWAGETATGRLLMSKQVTGSGTWQLIDNPAAKIEIDVASVCLTGNVTINKGTLDVDANFQTEGQLTFGGTDALIDVAATKSAKFSLPNACPD